MPEIRIINPSKMVEYYYNGGLNIYQSINNLKYFSFLDCENNDFTYIDYQEKISLEKVLLFAIKNNIQFNKNLYKILDYKCKDCKSICSDCLIESEDVKSTIYLLEKIKKLLKSNIKINSYRGGSFHG